MKTTLKSENPRIILADDHEWILQILVDVTKQTLPQAEVIAVNDGLKALVAYEQGGADFVVTNHTMPEMNGMSLIQHLREITPELPILMVSVKPESRVDAMAAGANWFLSKQQITEHMPGLLLDQLGGGLTPL